MVLQSISIASIRDAATNPRDAFNDIEELAASMTQHGMIQPVVVRPIPLDDQGHSHELIAGHRRIAAAKFLEWESVDAIISDDSGDKAEIMEKHLIENVQRDNLKPYELAQAIGQLLKVRKRGGQKKLAENLGKSPAWVSKLKTIADALPSPIPDNLKAIMDIDKLYAWATKSVDGGELTEEEEEAAKKKADKLEELNDEIVEEFDMPGPKEIKVSYDKNGAFVVTFTFKDEAELRAKLGLVLDGDDEDQGELDV